MAFFQERNGATCSCRTVVSRDHWPRDESIRPRLVLAHAERGYFTHARGWFRTLGIEVVVARSAQETHTLTHLLDPCVVVMADRLPDESGFLTCAKIKTDHPDCKVILLGQEATSTNFRFAVFAGAELFMHPAHDWKHVVYEVLGLPPIEAS
jgi:DNA-binding NarL/FixJ family response regulator